MERTIKKVLNAIEKNGFEAYIVGGYVRDLMLNKISWDVDICTNALPKDLVKLFPNSNVGIYGAVDFKIGKYSFEITTYRKEFNYENRHPSKVEYINNLLEDIKRRDFKINTICMNQNGNIIDLLNATSDIENHIISSFGDADLKMKEDPLRILRAIRFATVLDFDIDEELLSCIKRNKNLVLELSDSRIIDEMTKILISDNYVKGLHLLKDLGITDLLEISYDKVVKTNDVNGMWAQLNFKKNLAFNKETIHNINTIRSIIDSGNVDLFSLYKYGLYFNIVAGEVLKIDNKKIASLYHHMPIKCRKDIKISSTDIMALLNIKEGEEIGFVLAELENAILSRKVTNSETQIKKYIIDNFRGE